MALINDKNHELSVAFFSNLLFPQSQFDREIILDSLDLCTAGPKKIILYSARSEIERQEDLSERSGVIGRKPI